MVNAIRNLPERRRLLPAVVFFTAAGLALYSDVIVNGVFLFDDFEYVVDNAMIRDLSSLNLTDTRQIGYMSFGLNYALGGLNPLGYHLANVLIHICNAILAFLLIRLVLNILSGSIDVGPRRLSEPTAFIAAVLFLIHPVETQAVSYVTQRFTSLASLFYLLSVFLYLSARTRLEREDEHQGAYILYGLSLLTVMLAMKTKEIAFTIPFTIAIFEVLLFRASVYGRRRFYYLVPFAALLAFIPLSILGPEWNLIGRGEGIAETTRQEKLYDLFERPLLEYLFTQFRVIVTYIRLLLLPLNQKVVYDYKVSQTFFEMRALLALCILFLLAGYAWHSWRKSRAAAPEDMPGHRLVSLGIIWFFVTLSVESSVMPIKDIIFEHRVYLPSVGFFAACSVLLLKLGKKIADTANIGFSRAVAGLLAVLVIPLSAATYIRNEIWTDEVRFWDDVVRKEPDKAIGYHNRGNAYAKIGRYDLALPDMDRTISYFPRNPAAEQTYETADFTVSNMSKTYLNRGKVRQFLGLADLAKADYEKANLLASFPSLDVDKALRLAEEYAKQGADQQAGEQLENVLQWDPGNVDALNNRGSLHSRKGNFDAAIADFNRALSLRPDFAPAYYNRGIVYARSGDRKRAGEDFEAACARGFQPACEGLEKLQQGK